MLRAFLIEEDTRRACARDGPKVNAGASCAFDLSEYEVQRTEMNSVAAKGQLRFDPVNTGQTGHGTGGTNLR